MAGGNGEVASEPQTCNSVGFINFFIGLFGGTGCSIVMKVMYTVSAQDSTGGYSYFEKPLFLTMVMFMAMTLALPVFALMQLFKHPDERDKVPWGVLVWLIIPSIFDLAGTNFAQIGLVYTTVSYFQLLRCSVIIVTAFLKAFVLKMPLSSYMWWGVAINTAAMIMVGSTSFLGDGEGGESSTGSNPALGVTFILLSCVVQGSQYIFEEKVMAVDDAPPLIVIGMEGLWGTLIMLIIFPIVYYVPGDDKGSIENILDSLVMIQNSVVLQNLLIVFFFTITTYNIACIYVTAYLSAVWHAILDNFRPVSVWGTDLLIFYVITNGAFGEPWSKYSWLQFFGMCVLFFGTAVYNGSVTLPWIDYSRAKYVAVPGTPGMRAPPNMSTADMMHSPLIRRLSEVHGHPPAHVLNAQARLAERDMEHGHDHSHGHSHAHDYEKDQFAKKAQKYGL